MTKGLRKLRIKYFFRSLFMGGKGEKQGWVCRVLYKLIIRLRLMRRRKNIENFTFPPVKIPFSPF